MFRNYLKIAWRNLRNHKFHSFLNIFGLSLGIACFLLIMLYVNDEFSYDRFNDKADRIYRVNTDVKFGGIEQLMAIAPDPLGPTLKNDYPQIEEYVRFYAKDESRLVRKGSELIDEHRIVHADSTLFNVFTLPVVAGNSLTALNAAGNVVITASMAKKYFGSINCVGEVLEANRKHYRVTAVIRDIPDNAHFNFDFIFPMSDLDYEWGNFLSANFQTYVVLKKGVDYRQFNKNLRQVVDKYIFPQAKEIMQISSADQLNGGENKFAFTLFPLTDIHLRSDRQGEIGANGNVQFVYIFLAIAVFILMIACINFMNLSTARSAARVKEVGIRKVLGTDRQSLIYQFLMESTVTSVISLLFALVLVISLLPVFNQLASKKLSVFNMLDVKLLLTILVLPFLIGLGAGCYPAFFMSRFQPIKVLKGMTGTLRKSNFRNMLVIFQFATSAILIICTIVVFRQLNFIQSKDVGFDKQQVLIINGAAALKGKEELFKQEVLGINSVKAGTVTGYLPVSGALRKGWTYWKNATMDLDNSISVESWEVDVDYIKTMDMKMAKGRDFSKSFMSDSGAVIINESMARSLGYADPVGQKIYTGTAPDVTVLTIIGVVKNFNYESLRKNIGPLCLTLGRSNELVSFRLNTAQVGQAVRQIESKWRENIGDARFNYRFLDEDFNRMYFAERRIGKIAVIFAGLAVLIACLGLFGLATYMAEQRTKEISVRKVLGASVGRIIFLLSIDFLKLVMVAVILAAPVSYYFMNKWLGNFAFRSSFPWWVFLVAAVMCLVIAFVTISYQTIRVARLNPVKSLRAQ
ncbi:putative ABC transport system permease protein [Chitinophaga eiseniae]|uniref:Putative ABC transport system permease protein n=1 Tax=Chitinophaga eiseniae TaxID=634771 RepID=A0A1T4P4U2_9BACT|nr:ABC transporter permease [Chitinophaga eiseniae]SJZ86620.1 putative ABC transport system permease protein [Chitinophaga eiseniae]